jgi:hypothetical protein
MIRVNRLYTIPNSSINVRVLNVHHKGNETISCMLSFEYKNGGIIEIKDYILEKDKINHWKVIN